MSETTPNAPDRSASMPIAEREDATRNPQQTSEPRDYGSGTRAPSPPSPDGGPTASALDGLRASAPAVYEHLTGVWPMDAARNLETAIGYASELFADEPALAEAFASPAVGDNGRLIEAAHHAAIGRRILYADDPLAALAEHRPDVRLPAERSADQAARADAPPRRRMARIDELMRRPDYWSENVQDEVQRLYRDMYGSAPIVGRAGRLV